MGKLTHTGVLHGGPHDGTIVRGLVTGDLVTISAVCYVVTAECDGSGYRVYRPQDEERDTARGKIIGWAWTCNVGDCPGKHVMRQTIAYPEHAVIACPDCNNVIWEREWHKTWIEDPDFEVKD